MSTAVEPRHRRSRVRQSILEYLRTVDGHPSAEEVYVAMRTAHPRVSFGTVYRNLNILTDQGEVKRLESSRGRDLFDGQRPFHAHLRCESCGQMIDLPLDPEKIIRDISSRTGHRISGHHIEFSGVCRSCQSRT